MTPRGDVIITDGSGGELITFKRNGTIIVRGQDIDGYINPEQQIISALLEFATLSVEPEKPFRVTSGMVLEAGTTMCSKCNTNYEYATPRVGFVCYGCKVQP